MTKNIISHNCVSGRIYQQQNLKNGNPFVWCMIMPDDFWYLYNNYKIINYKNIKVESDKTCRKIIIDDKVGVLYPHYRYDKSCVEPTKKTPVDIYYNKIDEFVVDRYNERLERMTGEPLFIVTDREFPERPQYNFKKPDLLKYVDKKNCIVAVYDKSITGDNVVYMPKKNMDPKDIAEVILANMEKPKNVMIVNFNTQNLTDACIKSINKHTPGCKIYIFDNSDVEPFVNTFGNVEVLDNTKGQIIDFDKWLENYPNRRAAVYSSKHCYTIQKFIDDFKEPFILMDSDILVKKDISSLWDENLAYVGQEIGGRVLPFICFINPKILSEKGVRYFDEEHTYDLNGENPNKKYDTGYSLYANREKLPHKKINFMNYVVHYAGGSYSPEYFKISHKGQITKEAWLEKYKMYWRGGTTQEPVVVKLVKKETPPKIEEKLDNNLDNVSKNNEQKPESRQVQKKEKEQKAEKVEPKKTTILMEKKNLKPVTMHKTSLTNYKRINNYSDRKVILIRRKS